MEERDGKDGWLCSYRAVSVNLNIKGEARTTRGLGALAQGKGRPGHARAKTSTQKKRGKKRKGKKKKGTSRARKYASAARAARAHTPRRAKARL